MYFPHAFEKVMIGVNSGGSMLFNSATNTSGLASGEIGIFDPKTYTKQTSSNYGEPFIIAQGSFHTVDKIGPVHGGYKESNKSKMINPKYISRFFKVSADTAKNQIVSVGWNHTVSGTGNQFVCGKNYYLRLDLKGSPALRFLTHNMYKTFQAYTGCCTDDCSGTCTGDAVDPITVYLQWADSINNDPLWPKFIQAEVRKVKLTVNGDTTSGSATISNIASTTDVSVGDYVYGPGVNGVVSSKTSTTLVLSTTASVTATATGVDLTVYTKPVTSSYVPEDMSSNPTVTGALVLTVAYAETKFGNCTFTPTDHYELEPLFIYASIVDETGDPCAVWPHANSSTGEYVTELQAPQQANVTGETVLRKFILSNRYMQEPFHDSMTSANILRMRETEDDISLGNVTRSSLYNMYGLLHNVPRFNNATNSFSHDQYLITIFVPSGVSASAFETFISGHLSSAGNGVTMETY